ncbi:MAG: hypothetical protein HZA79_03780 [Sphingobacteriales bacterium]|nr:hypothetical protein [Sphingobacteriales bacterium]
MKNRHNRIGKNSWFWSSLLLVAFSFYSSALEAQQNKGFTIENYYKVKWGFADEFISLWKLNHYPLLQKALKKGDILSVTAEKPRLHSGEDTRFDFKVTIVFRDEKAAFDPNLTEPYKKELYPDLEKLKKDEQHRFELLLSHWDVLIENILPEGQEP